MNKDLFDKLTTLKMFRSDGHLSTAFLKFINNHKDIKEEIDLACPDCNSLQEQLYCLNHERGTCVICGKPTPFLSYNYGYRKSCCDICEKELSKITFKEASRYSNTEESKAKRVNTFKIKYKGATNAMQVDTFKIKNKETNKRNHGGKLFFQTEEGKFGSNNAKRLEDAQALLTNTGFSLDEATFVNFSTKAKFYCNTCKSSWYATPSSVLSRHSGCPNCKGLKSRLTKDEFLKRIDSISKGRYSIDEIKNWTGINSSKITVFCPNHGKFITSAKSLLAGHGCPMCSTSHGEQTIINFLNENSIEFTSQKTFTDCRSEKGHLCKFDFYLPQYNIIIEYHGDQHYHPNSFFDQFNSFEDRLNRDKLKKRYCLEHKISFIEINQENIEIKLKELLSYFKNLKDINV